MTTVSASGLVRSVIDAAPLIDGHNDVPWQLRRRYDNDLRTLGERVGVATA